MNANYQIIGVGTFTINAASEADFMLQIYQQSEIGVRILPIHTDVITAIRTWVTVDNTKTIGILTSTLKVGEGSAGFGLCARLWRKPTEPLTVLYVDVKL